MHLFALSAALLVMLVSLSGKLVTWQGFGAFFERNLHFLVSFASGVLLLTAWNLTQEIIEHAGSLSQGLPWIVIGICVILVAFRYVPQFHHHHEIGDRAHTRIDANRVLVGDAIHNIGDGIVIVVAFAASPAVGIASTISIMVHEMLQEISEFFVLREVGFSVRRALVSNFLVSSTILVGTFGAFFLLEKFQALEIPLLGLSIGSYLVVVFHDLIPHSISGGRGGMHYVQHAVYFLAGALLMALLMVYLPHDAA